MHLSGRLLIVFALIVAADALGADGDDWFLDDFEDRLASVNDGELHFLPGPPPSPPPHHHHNTLHIDTSSLATGWARMHQCHEHLDAVPRTQVVYNADRIRGLWIQSAEDIGEAWVEGATVQLRDVGKASRLCVNAETQIVHRNADGSYSVRNGPFMRRFLDGYYPMRVSMDIVYPPSELAFVALNPNPQPGLELAQTPGRVRIEAVFEGRLRTDVRFRPPTSASP